MKTKTRLLWAALVVLGASLAVYPTMVSGSGPTVVEPPRPAALTSHAQDEVRGSPVRTPVESPPEPRAEAAKAPPTPPTPPRKTIHGRVQDLAAAGLAGMTVGFEQRSYTGTTQVGGMRRPEYDVSTTADGSFTMPQPDGPGYLVARSKTHVTLLDAAWNRAGRGHVIVAAPRGHYRGIVVFEDGTPAAGQKLELRPDHGFLLGLRPGVPPSTDVVWRATTGEDGRFAFEDVPFSPGTAILVNATGYEPVRHVLTGTSDAAIRITLLRTRASELEHALSGRVVFGTGEPVSGARVFFGTKVTRTSADGGFVIRLDAPHGGGDVLAATKGWLPATKTITAGSTAPIVLTIEHRPLHITGRVVDDRGRPVIDAVVFTRDGKSVPQENPYGPRALEDFIDPAHRQGRPERGRSCPVRSAGRFELSALLPGTYQVFAMHDRTLFAVSAGRVRAGTEDLEIVLDSNAATRRVAGRVLTLTGAPLAGVRLFVGRSTELDGAKFFAPLVTQGVPKTDGDGRFAFEALCVEGTWLLPSGGGISSGDRIQLDPGADLTRLELRLPVKCRFQVLMQEPDVADAISVLDGEGRRLRLLVHLANSAWSASTMELDKGRSQVIEVDERARTLVLSKSGKEVRRVALQLRADDTTVVRL